MPAYRPIEFKFDEIPSLPDLDLRTSEYVYFVESDTDCNLIKIGRTESLKRRLQSLQAACPVQLRVIAAIRAPAGTELLFHQMFASARVHGEWFFPTTEVLTLVKALPKMGTLSHKQVREVCEMHGCDALQITRAFMGYGRSKKPRAQYRNGQLVFR